jgi:signal transduction histidine kinase
VLDSSTSDAREALLAIEDSGRNAMTELRHLLSLLAPDLASSDEVLPPQPGLDLVPELVGGVRSAGLPVSLSVHGARRELPAGLDLAAFRVVQEALTNVLKHAPAASTTVRISYRDADLLIEVADDGAGRAPRDPASGHGASGQGNSGHGASGQGSSGHGGSGQGSSGRGLLGLRERIAIYGGSLEAGPRPGGGWLVRATIPLEAAAPGYLPASAASV